MTPQWDPIANQLIDGETGLPIQPGTDLGNGFIVPGVPTTNAPSPTTPVTAPLVAPPPAALAPTATPGQPGIASDYSVHQTGTTSLVPLTTIADTMPEPAGLTPNDPYVLAKQAAKVADNNVARAYDAVQKAQADYNTVSQNPNALAQGRDTAAAGAQLSQASANLSAAWKSQSDSYTKIADASAAALSRAKDPDLKNYYQSNSVDALARAHLADVQAAGFDAKNTADIAKTTADTNKTIQDMVNSGILTPAQAQEAQANAANLQATATRTLTLLPTEVAAGQAGVAKAIAETGLVGAQTEKTGAETTLTQAQAQLADAQAKLAAATLPSDVAAAQAKVDAAQQALDQAKALQPGLVAQQGATLANTQAGTENTLATAEQTRQGTLKAQQGAQFGLEQKRDQLIAMVRAHEIDGSPGGEADQMWASIIKQAYGGATPYQQEQEQTQRLGQQSQLAGTQTSVFGNLASSTLGSMAAANKDAPAGSDALAKSYGGLIAALLPAFQSFAPNTPPAMIAGAGAAPAAGSFSQYSPNVDPASVVHAAVSAALGNPTGSSSGGAAGAAPATPGPNALNAIQYGANPLAPGQMPAMLAGGQLGTPDHVDQLWAGTGFGSYGSQPTPGQRGGLTPLSGPTF